MSRRAFTLRATAGCILAVLAALGVLAIRATGQARDDGSEVAAPRANRLADQTSPYLLLHAHNPVDWYPWGPEAFAKAKAEDKPIFLSIGYSSCFWCHVMERECFEDPEIARLMNEKFVNIKVDREERPDVDHIYMTALQAFGTGGGWPLSMFLTPDGKPFYGGTYFPPVPRDDMPSFPNVLNGVANAWRDERTEVDRAADQLADIVRRATEAAGARMRVPLKPEMAASGEEALADQFDPEHGGFGFSPVEPRQPKFPEPANLLFLLDRHRREPGNPVARRLGQEQEAGGRASTLDLVTTTLDHLARGGIRDHLGGGYHRYSTERTWTVPHFEKMLYDNALLATAFLETFEITGDTRWRREAEDVFAFVAREMTDPERGGFYSAIDAQTDGEEGAYYVWTRDEVERVLGDGPDTLLFLKTYNLTGRPSFEEDRYVLHRPTPLVEHAASLGLSPEELESRLAPLRGRLREVRDQRERPLLDDKVLTAWNGLMIAAYADGFRLLGDETYRQAAEQAAEFVWSTLRTDDGRLLRTYRADEAKLDGYLEDYAFLALGLLRLHAATGEATWLDRARELADRMIDDFADAERGGFYFTAADHESLLARPKDPYDSATPSGNSVAVRVLLDLAEATGEARYREVAGEALANFSYALERSPSGVPYMLLGLLAYLDEEPSTEPPANPPSASDPDDVVRASTALAEGQVPNPGATVRVDLTLEIADGWHVGANPVDNDLAIPTAIELAPSEAAAIEAVEYPEGEPLTVGEDESLAMSTYADGAVIPITLRLSDDLEPGPLDLTLRLRYQSCNDRVCLPPATLDVPLRLEVPVP